jgi:hypothetical protein
MSFLATLRACRTLRVYASGTAWALVLGLGLVKSSSVAKLLHLGAEVLHYPAELI